MSKITINGVMLDPLAQGPALAAANLHADDATDSDYILIQTTQSLSKDMKSELANMGVVILEYVPDDTYLCYFPGTDLDQIRSLAYVAWANIYMQGFKVAPSLMTGPAAAPAGARNLLEIVSGPCKHFEDDPESRRCRVPFERRSAIHSRQAGSGSPS